MRLFSSLPLILLLLVLWPLMLLTFLFACAWLERSTLVPREVVPRRLRRMRSAPPEKVEEMVLKETAEVVARYWSSTGELPADALGAVEPPDGRAARRVASPDE
jgi:hypothetical protein